MRLYSVRIALTFAGALLLVAQCVFAAVPLHGVVRDPLGGAVRDADIVIATPERASIVTARTDAEGRFALTVPVPGVYLLIVTSPGFMATRLAVTVTAAGTKSNTSTGRPSSSSRPVTVNLNRFSMSAC